MYNNYISDIEAECKSKYIELETARIVRFNFTVMSESVYDHIVDTISSDVVNIINDFEFRLIVCNAEMATYLELTYGDYITYIYTYKEWHDHRIQYE